MSINEGLWSAKMPNGDVRSGTLDQLGEAFRAGHLGEGTLVRAAGSENWMKLADVLGSAAAFSAPVVVAVARPSPQPPPPAALAQPSPPPVNGSTELWQVKLPTGDVRSGTRQQLEEAFRAGHLDEGAVVLAPGAPEWMPLGNLLRPTQPPPASLPPTVPPPAVVAPPRSSPQSSAPPPPPPTAQSSAPPPSVQVDGSAELWHVRLADGQVRSGTRQQLQEAFTAGHLDDAALVMPAGASQWVPLGSIMDRRPSASVPPPAPAPEPAPDVAAEPAPVAAQPEPAMAMEPPQPAPSPEAASDGQSTAEAEAQSEEPLLVRLTLKQLEEAFQARLLDDDTQVLPAGADEWVSLGDIRRALPPPFGSALAQPMDKDTAAEASPGLQGSALHPEPASRTQPWPATAPASAPSSAGD